MRDAYLVGEVEALLTAAGQEVRGVLGVGVLADRLCLLWGAPQQRLCPPPCRDRAAVHEVHVRVGRRCCEATSRWEGERGRRRWLDGLGSLAGVIVLLAERDDPLGLSDLAPRLRALAALLLAEGLVTPTEECARGWDR